MMCSYHKPIDADTGNTVLCISKSMPNHSTVYMLIRTLDHRKMKYTCSILMTNQFLLYVYFQSIISAKMNMLPQSSVTVHVELFNFVTFSQLLKQDEQWLKREEQWLKQKISRCWKELGEGQK